MISKVNNSNKLAWANMCVMLWPESSVNEILEEFNEGRAEEGFLYYEEGQPAGIINLSLRRDYVEGTSSSPVAYIEGIYVKEEFRKKGIARKMISYAKSWGKEQGCNELASDCELENDNSRRFHRASGFKEAGVIVCFTMDIE